MHLCFIKVGKTFSYGNGRLDDNKALAELGFQVTYYASITFSYNSSFFPIKFSQLPFLIFSADWRLLGCGYIVMNSPSMLTLMFRCPPNRSNFGMNSWPINLSASCGDHLLYFQMSFEILVWQRLCLLTKAS